MGARVRTRRQDIMRWHFLHSRLLSTRSCFRLVAAFELNKPDRQQFLQTANAHHVGTGVHGRRCTLPAASLIDRGHVSVPAIRHRMHRSAKPDVVQLTTVQRRLGQLQSSLQRLWLFPVKSEETRYVEVRLPVTGPHFAQQQLAACEMRGVVNGATPYDTWRR